MKSLFAMPWRCGGGEFRERGAASRAGLSRDDVPKKGSDEHNQRNVEREAGAGFAAMHREGLVAIGQHRRQRDHEGGQDADDGCEEAHDGLIARNDAKTSVDNAERKTKRGCGKETAANGFGEKGQKRQRRGEEDSRRKFVSSQQRGARIDDKRLNWRSQKKNKTKNRDHIGRGADVSGVFGGGVLGRCPLYFAARQRVMQPFTGHPSTKACYIWTPGAAQLGAALLAPHQRHPQFHSRAPFYLVPRRDFAPRIASNKFPKKR